MVTLGRRVAVLVEIIIMNQDVDMIVNAQLKNVERNFLQ
jgi:hypothetical protein